MVFYASLAQAGLVAFVRPAQLLDWAARWHRARVVWILEGGPSEDPSQAMAHVISLVAPKGLGDLYVMQPRALAPEGSDKRSPGGFTLLSCADPRKAVLLRFSPVLQYLDCIALEASRVEGGRTELRAASMSCCCFPAWMPLGGLLGLLLSWLPFPDFGANLGHLRDLRRGIDSSGELRVAEERLLEAGGGCGLAEMAPSRALSCLPPTLVFFLTYPLPLGFLVLSLLLSQQPQGGVGYRSPSPEIKDS